jgi:hypothetical protein
MRPYLPHVRGDRGSMDSKHLDEPLPPWCASQLPHAAPTYLTLA